MHLPETYRRKQAATTAAQVPFGIERQQLAVGTADRQQLDASTACLRAATARKYLSTDSTNRTPREAEIPTGFQVAKRLPRSNQRFERGTCWLRFFLCINASSVSSPAAGRCGVQRPAGYGLSALDVELTLGHKNQPLMLFHAGIFVRVRFYPLKAALRVLRMGWVTLGSAQTRQGCAPCTAQGG